MFPFRTSSIFRSRWMALLWAAGILWTAYDVASDAPSGDEMQNGAVATDATGQPVSMEQVDALRDTLEGL
jgi:hypothetical protein